MSECRCLFGEGNPFHVEGCPALAPDERQAGLREALVPLIDEIYQRGLDAPEAADFMVAALAAQVPQEERLDVEIDR